MVIGADGDGLSECLGLRHRRLARLEGLIEQLLGEPHSGNGRQLHLACELGGRLDGFAFGHQVVDDPHRLGLIGTQHPRREDQLLGALQSHDARQHEEDGRVRHKTHPAERCTKA
ncbi:hypothetical protein D3C87_1680890 [compost metagenome]